MAISFLTDKNIFEEEEKIILNHLAIEGDKDSCCEKLKLGISISNDEYVIKILEDLLTKITGIKEDEWLELQSCLPYEISIKDEDFFIV